MIAIEALQHLIENWAESKGILSKSSARAQLLKAVAELGELCDAEIKGDFEEQVDGVGDVLVCLIIYCKMKNVTLEDCLNHAWEEIKDRKGKMVDGGAFVKEP